jgi:hypothetical protein
MVVESMNAIVAQHNFASHLDRLHARDTVAKRRTAAACHADGWISERHYARHCSSVFHPSNQLLPPTLSVHCLYHVARLGIVFEFMMGVVIDHHVPCVLVHTCSCQVKLKHVVLSFLVSKYFSLIIIERNVEFF